MFFRSLIRSIAFSPTRGFPSDISERRSFQKSLVQGFAEATLPLSPLCRFSDIFSYPQRGTESCVVIEKRKRNTSLQRFSVLLCSCFHHSGKMERRSARLSSEAEASLSSRLELEERARTADARVLELQQQAICSQLPSQLCTESCATGGPPDSPRTAVESASGG